MTRQAPLKPAPEMSTPEPPPPVSSHTCGERDKSCSREQPACATVQETANCSVLLAGNCPLTGEHVSIRDYIAANKPAIGRMLRGVFEISTPSEAERLATMLASHCPEPERASIGIWELLANAIEHGNLEIDFALKSELLMQGRLHAEIARRLLLPQYNERRVRVVFQRNRRTIRLRIADQGKGFDFESALKAKCPTTAPNGRGLMLARTMTFSRLRFIGAGNVVDAVIDLEHPPQRPLNF